MTSDLFRKPQVVTVEEMSAHLATSFIPCASARRKRPNDEERKSFDFRGDGMLIVSVMREGTRATHYEGTDLAQAVRIYNDLR